MLLVACVGARLIAAGHRLTACGERARRGWNRARIMSHARVASRHVRFLLARGPALDLAARALMYLAAGALDRRALRETITRNWDEFSRTEAAILSGLMAWEQAWYERMLKP